MRRRTRAFTPAFTLVELLVVIGIIALLISILLPALSNARKSANAVKCLSNLRSLGQAYVMYAGEHKGVIPVVRQDYPDPGAAVGQYYWSDMIAPYIAKVKGITTASSALDMAEAEKTIVWGCPEYQRRTDISDTLAPFYPGYGMNLHPYFKSGHSTVQKTETICRWTTGDVYPGKYYKLGSITSASERMLLADSALWILDARASAGGGIPGLPGGAVDFTVNNAGKTGQKGLMDYDLYRHSKRPSGGATGFYDKSSKMACNMLFFDSHAATITGLGEAYYGIFIMSPP